jgi:predicted Rossmann-fold nucleotide-binding protein
MEEMIEVLTWCQLKVINKPIYIFNPDGYWDHMLAMFDHAAKTGFIRPQHTSLVKPLSSLTDIADALDQLLAKTDLTKNPISNL